MLEILRGKRSEEMTQSNTSFPWGLDVSFESQRVMAVDVPKKKRFLEEERIEGKRSRYCYPSKKRKYGSISIKEREQEIVV